MMWGSEICALIVGVGASSMVWMHLTWKREARHDATEQRLLDEKSSLVEAFEEEKSVWTYEVAAYHTDREPYNDVLISVTQQSKELKKQLAEIEHRRREFERCETEFQERETLSQRKIDDLEGQLKGARAKKRRQKNKENFTPPSVCQIEED